MITPKEIYSLNKKEVELTVTDELLKITALPKELLQKTMTVKIDGINETDDDIEIVFKVKGLTIAVQRTDIEKAIVK